MKRKLVTDAEASLIPSVDDYLAVEHLRRDLKVPAKALTHLGQ